MNENGKIYIIVTDKMPGGQPNPTPKPQDNQNSNGDNGLLAHWAKNKLISSGKQLISTCVSYSLTNIGNFTGNYISQRNINNLMSNFSSFKNIGLTALAGAKIGGPVGAVVGLSLGVINESISSIFQIHSNMVQNSKTNYEIEQLRNRAGLNSKLDGSRGTEN